MLCQSDLGRDEGQWLLGTKGSHAGAMEGWTCLLSGGGRGGGSWIIRSMGATGAGEEPQAGDPGAKAQCFVGPHG